MTIIIDKGYTRTKVIIPNIQSVADVSLMTERILEAINDAGEQYEEIDIGPPDPNGEE